MIPIKISNDAEIAIYKRLASALEVAIAEGLLEPGAVMASSRELASSTGLSRATVVRAYELLFRSGHLIARAGGKTYISESLRQIALPSVDEISRTYDLPENISTFGKRLSTFDWTPNVNARFLNYGGPPLWALPQAKWKYLLSKVCSELDPVAINYGRHPFGDDSIRESIVNFLRRRKGIQCKAEQLITFTDSGSPLVYISRMLVNEGDVVVVEDPCRLGARDTLLSHGARLIAVPVDDNGIRTDIIKNYLHEHEIKMIYVSPSFHDPLGFNMSMQRRSELLELANEHNIAIVEDAWESDYSYITPNYPTLYSLSPKENIFYIYSFWKLFYPVSMASCLVVPPEFIRPFMATKLQANEVSSVIEQRTIAEFIDSGHLEKHIKNIRKSLIVKRQAMIEKLTRLFGKSLKIKKQSAAFWLTVEFRDHSIVEEMLALAVENGIKFVSTAPYYADGKGSQLEFLVPFADFLDKI
ncbi:MAG: PLP-dependent aminotransferase family protein [Candidatus Obscuribacterales bacterium]|nr:PLP-dependent aminotransferase family protein [Candidatus Obscuribacterales bacterium]